MFTSSRGFHVQQTFDDFLIVEREFVWRSSSYLLEKLVERSQDYCCFFLFLFLCTISLVERVDVLFDLFGGCESSHLFKGCFLSSLHRTGANFPSRRRNHCMNRVEYNYGAESIALVGFFRRSSSNNRHVALSHGSISANVCFHLTIY